MRARRRSSLSFPTQESTLVSYGSTDIDSNEIRPIEEGRSEPPSRTGTPTLQNFSKSSPSNISLNSTIPTRTSSELRGNPFLPPTFQQRQDFNFVQEPFRVQPLHSPNISLWSATSPNSAASSSTTPPKRTNNTSLSEPSGNIPQSQLNFFTNTKNNALSPSSFIPEKRRPSSHPGRTRSTPIYNPNPPTRSRITEHTYLFALDHKTWNPPPPFYGTTNLGDTFKNWSRNRLVKTLYFTARQRNTALEVLATPNLELNFNTAIKYDTIFNHPFHATTPSIITTTTQHHLFALNSYINLIDTPSRR